MTEDITNGAESAIIGLRNEAFLAGYAAGRADGNLSDLKRIEKLEETLKDVTEAAIKLACTLPDFPPEL